GRGARAQRTRLRPRRCVRAPFGSSSPVPARPGPGDRRARRGAPAYGVPAAGSTGGGGGPSRAGDDPTPARDARHLGDPPDVDPRRRRDPPGGRGGGVAPATGGRGGPGRLG